MQLPFIQGLHGLDSGGGLSPHLLSQRRAPPPEDDPSWARWGTGRCLPARKNGEAVG